MPARNPSISQHLDEVAGLNAIIEERDNTICRLKKENMVEKKEMEYEILQLKTEVAQLRNELANQDSDIYYSLGPATGRLSISEYSPSSYSQSGSTNGRRRRVTRPYNGSSTKPQLYRPLEEPKKPARYAGRSIVP